MQRERGERILWEVGFWRKATKRRKRRWIPVFPVRTVRRVARDDKSGYRGDSILTIRRMEAYYRGDGE